MLRNLQTPMAFPRIIPLDGSLRQCLYIIAAGEQELAQ